jgi:2-C-methyl-D-erythritol 4-phosphate cytidylyltransferase
MKAPNSDSTAAIIVAAGSSRRMGQDKIFADIRGKPLIARVIDTCQQSAEISEIILVFNNNNIDAGRELCSRMNWTKVTAICTGGDRRQDSVQQGLNKIGQCKWVLIQDGARPFITT